jgi:hypothetical protein
MCDSNQLYKNTNRTKLDEFGGHALHCASNSSGFHTKYWHNPLATLVSLFAQLSRVAGFETKTEVDNILVVGPSGMRADVVLKGKDHLVKCILDVRTSTRRHLIYAFLHLDAPVQRQMLERKRRLRNGALTLMPKATLLFPYASKQEGGLDPLLKTSLIELPKKSETRLQRMVPLKLIVGNVYIWPHNLE